MSRADLLFPSFSYYLDDSDPDIVILRRQGFSATEPAPIGELTKVRIEVHVHPLDPTLPSFLYSQLYLPTTDSATTEVRVHRGV